MAFSSTLLERRKKRDCRDGFEDYSIELGLRTHRPSDDSNHYYRRSFAAAPTDSTITPAGTQSVLTTGSGEREAVFPSAFQLSSKHHSNKLRHQLSMSRDGVASPQHSSLNTLSHCSNVAQSGNVSDWWDLPPRISNTNYEQKTKSVRVSYSVDEIYGKANVKKSSQTSLEKPAPRFSVCENGFPDPAMPKHKSVLSREKLDAWSSTPEHNHFTTNSTFFNATQEHEEPFNGIDSQMFWKTHGLDPMRSHKTLFAPSTEVKYRSFEEAINLYPDEDSDDSEMSSQSISHGNPESTDDAETMQFSHQVVASDSFAVDEESSPLDALTNASSLASQENFLPSPATTTSLETDMESNSVTGELKEMNLMETTTIKLSSAEAWIAPADEEPAVLEASPKLKASPPDVATSPPADGLDKKSTKDILQSQPSPTKSKSLPRRKQQRTDEADAHPQRNGDKVPSLSDLTDTLTHEVPPIDLSRLSPRPSMSTKFNSKAMTNVASSSKNKKSVPVQTQAKKGRASANVPSKSVDTHNRRQIAREIKLRVQRNPACIAGEIKRRVEQKSKKAPKTSTMYAESHSQGAPIVDTKAATPLAEDEYLRLKTTSQPSSFRSYDRYIAMSPRIESGEISRWQCLPEEVWLVILSFLELSDLHSFMLTCSDFNRLANDWSLWNTVSLYKKYIADDEIIRLGHLHPSRLSIVHCTGVKMNGDTVSNRGLREMFSSCGKNLKHLSTASCVMPPLSGEAMLHHAVLHCPAIQSLDVSWCNLTNRDVELISDSFPVLTSLCVNGNQAITDIGMVKLLQQLHDQLQRVEVQGCFKLTNRTLEEIGSCTSLHTLNIGQCHKFYSACVLREVSRLPNLTSCNLKGLKQVKDNCVAGIVKCCMNIKHLVISQCTSLTPKTLIELSCSLHRLEKLSLSSCKECVNDSSLQTLLTNCKKLVSLDLSSTQVNDQSVGAIGASCCRMQELRLNFCPVTDIAIKNLLVECKSLKAISLFGVKGISVEELSATHPHVSIET